MFVVLFLVCEIELPPGEEHDNDKGNYGGGDAVLYHFSLFIS